MGKSKLLGDERLRGVVMYEIEQHQSLGDSIMDSPFLRWLKGDTASESTAITYGDEQFGPPAPLVYYGPPAPVATVPAKTSTSTNPKAIPVAPSIAGSPVVASSGNMLNWIIGGGVVVMGGLATWMLWPKINQSLKGKKG